MKLGTSTITTDESIRPDALAKALEERGFDSLVVGSALHTFPPVGPRRTRRAAICRASITASMTQSSR